jgi:uridine phosphorylase
MKKSTYHQAAILSRKHYDETSVFQPENLLREARRQKSIPDCEVPEVCVLDPDGDLADYLLATGRAVKNECWACYHSSLYSFEMDGVKMGILPCAVGAPYAVLVAEQLFVSGCRLLLSVTSAGIICPPSHHKRFGLIARALRDEGTSYHYLPPDQPARLTDGLFQKLSPSAALPNCPFFEAVSWTTDAPYRETPSAIAAMKAQGVTCVEMEAAALYAFAQAKNKAVACFAHITNSMAQTEGDFEKGEAFGSIDTLNLLSTILQLIQLDHE